MPHRPSPPTSPTIARSPLRRRAAAAALGSGVLALVSVVAAARPVAAHSDLTFSCPGAEEVVSELPAIDLVFSSPLDATREEPPEISLATADGRTELDVGDATLIDANRLTAPVPVAPDAGTYLVRYQVLLFDGDLNDGGFQFTYDPDAADATNCEVAPAAEATDPAGDDGDGGSAGLILLGIGAASISLVVWILRPRSTTAQTEQP